MTFPQAEASETIVVNSLDSAGRRDRAVDSRSSPAMKVLLFQSLFRGREDVYARRFESQKSARRGRGKKARFHLGCHRENCSFPQRAVEAIGARLIDHRLGGER